MARMTAVSREALKAATRIEVVEVSGAWAVKAWVGDRLCLVHGGDGFVMLYPSAGAAERAARRLNPAQPIAFTNGLALFKVLY